MADTMKIKLVKSLAGRQKDQIEIVKSLGLRKIGDVTEQPANAATEGKVFKVSHLVEVLDK
ncbi:MAG: 50S ribosomal protein L30 [Oscillospiraceae bacterium]|nr:50S ribosomal protein L30 [Oscillospiraceae bacterium]MDY3064779.1 50S ribosomal protein L30 [Oscillospiraceae bacterium]